jgi:signal transduction histidine kinase
MPRSALLITALVSIPFFYSSCGKPDKTGSGNTLYLDGVFTKADSIADGTAHIRESFFFLDSAYKVLPHLSAHDLYRLYDHKRFMYEHQHNYALSDVYSDSLLYIIRQQDPEYLQSPDYCRALFYKGDALMAKRDYTAAFIFYFQAHQLADRLLDTCNANVYSSTLGNVCYKQRRFRESAGYFLESYALLLLCRDADTWSHFYKVQEGLDNIALAYTGAGFLDSALYFYDSARSYIAHNTNRFQGTPAHQRFIQAALGVICGNEGDVWAQKGDTARAEALYQTSIRLNMHKNVEMGDAQLTCAKLAQLYLGSGRLRAAGAVLARLRSSLDSFPGPDAEYEFRNVSWRLHEKTGRFEDAFRDLLAFDRLKDSLDGGKPLSALDIHQELTHVASAFDLQYLQRRTQIKDLYLTIASIVIVMALVITLLLITSSRRSQRHVKTLTRLNQNMRNALNALEESHRENTNLLRVMAHDLRNPIGATWSIASILLEEPAIEEDTRHMLELIQTSSQSSLDLITDLLHSNSLTENLVKEPTDLDSLLSYCIEQSRFKAVEKSQTIVLNARPIRLLLNKEKIWRVLSNLLTNAIKFSPHGTTITASLYRKRKEAWIAIRDEGVGIPVDMRAGIFQLVGTSKTRGTAGEESFGLGLGISKQIVEAHGGRIWFDSEEGQGTTFYVVLPGLFV